MFQLSYAHAQKNIQTVLDSLIAKWAPDKRETICDFRVSQRIGRPYIYGETTELNAIKDLYKVMKVNKIRFYDGIKLLPDTNANKRCFGLVCVSVMNLRKSFSHSSELLSQAVLGTPVRILKDSNDYYLVQTPDKYIGWATQASVVRKTADEMKAWKKSNRALFTAKTGIIYEDSLQINVVSDIVMTSLVVLKSSGLQWNKVELPDLRQGFVERNSLVNFDSWVQNVKADTTAITQLSTQFLGVSYLWGGSSAHMLDCSGFMKTLYFMQGILLPRDASLQCKKGLKVELDANFSQLHLGDLLFFGHQLPTKQRVTHVGMYFGAKRFIHESEWVHVSSLDPLSADYSAYYHGRLLMVRRLIFPQSKVELIRNNVFYF